MIHWFRRRPKIIDYEPATYQKEIINIKLTIQNNNTKNIRFCRKKNKSQSEAPENSLSQSPLCNELIGKDTEGIRSMKVKDNIQKPLDPTEKSLLIREENMTKNGLIQESFYPENLQ